MKCLILNCLDCILLHGALIYWIIHFALLQTVAPFYVECGQFGQRTTDGRGGRENYYRLISRRSTQAYLSWSYVSLRVSHALTRTWCGFSILTPTKEGHCYMLAFELKADKVADAADVRR